MLKWGTGTLKTRKEALLITQYALPTSPKWALSCVNGCLFMKVDQENVGSSIARLVNVWLPNGETLTTTSVVTHVPRSSSDQRSSAISQK